MKRNKKELQYYQSLSLVDKIALSKTKIAEFYDSFNGYIYHLVEERIVQFSYI